MSRKSNILAKTLTILLVAILLLALLLPSAFANNNAKSALSAENSGLRVLGGGEILAMLGYTIDEAEFNYLNKYSSVSLTYKDTIPSTSVMTSYEDGRLTVTAIPWTYTMDDASVTWMPSGAELGGIKKEFLKNGDTYSLDFEVSDSSDESAQLKIDYKLTLNHENIDTLLGEAYNDAALWESYFNYKGELEEYNAEYLIYLNYLAEKQIYDEKLEEYNTYLSDIEEYNAAVENNKNLDELMEEYSRKYAEYQLYLVEKRQYDKEYAEYEIKYNAYRERAAKLQAQLSAIEATGVPMTDERTVYAAIMGDLVTKVIENKTLIASTFTGVSEKVVDDAGIATENLRELLKHYLKKCTTFEERYAYYSLNYEKFRDNFILLLQTLDKLYQNDKVRGILKAQEKETKYIILVAQLAYISNALSDVPIRSYDGNYTYDDNFKVGGKTVPEILEYKSYLTDTGNASPDPEGYPQEPKAPIAPTVIPEPKKPGEVVVPTYPDEVSRPGTAPKLVTEPTPPKKVERPDGESEKLDTPPGVAELLAAYKAGEIVVHEPLANTNISLQKTLTKYPFNSSVYHVTFYEKEYGSENNTFSSSHDVEHGTAVIYDGALPKRESTVSNHYKFSGWQTADGNVPDLSSVEENMDLYPVFTPSPRYYDVTFIYGNSETTLSVKYGDIPTPPENPSLPHDSLYIYEFDGWQISDEVTALLPVSENITYTAAFHKEYIFPCADGGAEVVEVDKYYDVDATASSSYIFNMENLLLLSANSRGVGINLRTRFGNVKISYSTALEMYKNGELQLSLPITQVLSHGYIYKIDVINSAGLPTEDSYRVEFSASIGSLSDDGTFTRTADDGASIHVKHSVADKVLAFSAMVGTEYSYIVTRSISALSSSLVGITAPASAHPGERVYITLATKEYAKLGDVFLLFSDGTEMPITGNSFVMPDRDVTIAAAAALREYTITFKDGDKVISRQTYKYGETVTPPGGISRASDGLYTYTFAGWGIKRSDGVIDIPAVTADATYIALYDAEIIVKENNNGKVFIEEKYLRLIIAAVIAVSTLILVVIPSSIISIVVVKRVRKMYRKRNTGGN